MGEVAKVSDKSLKALMAIFADSNKDFNKDAGDAPDILEVTEGVTSISNEALSSTHLALESFQQTRNAVQADLTKILSDATKAISEKADKYKAEITAASAAAKTRRKRFIPQGSAILNDYESVVRRVQTNLVTLREAKAAATVAKDAISSDNTETDINHRFYAWLPTILTAATQDIAAMHQG